MPMMLVSVGDLRKSWLGSEQLACSASSIFWVAAAFASLLISVIHGNERACVDGKCFLINDKSA